MSTFITLVIIASLILWYNNATAYKKPKDSNPSEPYIPPLSSFDPLEVPEDFIPVTPRPKSKFKWNHTKRDCIDYHEYIRSDKWFNNPARQATLHRDRWHCRLCQSIDNIEVHHITYKNVGQEREEDLISLCNECHNHTHKVAGPGAGYYPPIKRP